MKHIRYILIALAFPWFAAALSGQLRLEDDIEYPDGELTTVSFELWRAGGSPWAVVDNGAIVVDHTEGRVFDGRYQRLWPVPPSGEQVYASFKLTVTDAPFEPAGFSFFAIVNPTGEWRRSLVFMKRGRDPNSFRLGVSNSSGDAVNAVFFNADLLLNEEYTIIAAWDNVNQVSRLYIDAPNDESAHRVSLAGGTPRNDGFRRVGIYMNSDNHLGRYEIRSVRAGEDWASVWQDAAPKPDPIEDPDSALLLEDFFFYQNGELNTVSNNLWRIFPSAGTPQAEVVDNRVVVDYTKGAVFEGEYHRLWTVPDNPDQVYASFRLHVSEAPGETEGFNIVSFADRESPNFQRSRIFMKRGDGPDTFRLGLSASSAFVSDDEGDNTFFVERDLELGAEYLVLISWDALDFEARLFVNTHDFGSPEIVAAGDSTRELRRFAIRMDSAFAMGRYEISDILVAEDWFTVLQDFVVDDPDPAPGFYDDAVLGVHYYVGAGWVLWHDGIGGPDRGVLYVPLRESDGTGWVHHADRGWFHLMPGSIWDGIFAYGVDHGWIYASDDFGDWLYIFATGEYIPWVP